MRIFEDIINNQYREKKNMNKSNTGNKKSILRGFGYTVIAALVAMSCSTALAAPRWSAEKAKAWAKENPWWCGVNYIPANAVNYTAMWDKTSFSPDVIRRELKLMTDMGMNCVRFVMQYKVYEEDPDYFLETLEVFLALCDEAKVRAMPIFFDDCAFGTNTDPVTGRQPEPLEGWYAWAWSPSPGHAMVVDGREHPKLEKYVKDVMTRFGKDRRIMLWDLYNEPTNGRLGSRSLPLLAKTFAWAREVDPVQPISSGIWNANKELNAILLDNSDVVTFHCYADAKKTAAKIAELKAHGRPVICTEWMNRPAGSTVKDCLKLFADGDVGCILWGLVNGKTQTHLSWGHRPEKLPYKGRWQHDLFRGDFSPYDKAEIDLFKSVIAAKGGCGVSPVGGGRAQASSVFRGHENIEWSTSYAYGLIDRSRNLPRVLLIGDSICNGYQKGVRKRLAGKMNVTYWASSYCVTSRPYLAILSALLDEAEYDVIHFNNGLHSLETPNDSYERAYGAALRLIRSRQPKAKLVWCTSTPLTDAGKTAKCRELNAAAERAAAKAGVTDKDDLFALCDKFDRKADWTDVYHFGARAVGLQADQVAAIALKALGGRSAK